MESRRYFVGLDIGTTKIVAMVGTKNEYGKIKILGIGETKSMGVQTGTVSNIVKTTQSIKAAVEQAKNASGVDIKDVEVGIAGQHIRSMEFRDYIIRDNPDEVITERDIENLKRNISKLQLVVGEQIIHILPQVFEIDGDKDIKDPIGMQGSRLEAVFHVVVGQVNSIKKIRDCVKNAGLNLIGLTLEPLASAEAVLNEEEKEAGVALVDIGGGTTDLAIFKGNMIQYTSVIPYGGNVITSDIKEGCTIIEKIAELLKIQYGSAWPHANKENEVIIIPPLLNSQAPREILKRNLSLIIHARMKEIIELLFKEIEKYGYRDRDKRLIGGIVLTGGGSELEHLKFLVEDITGLSVRIGYPNVHLAGDSDKKMRSPIYATSVGLVMTAMNNDSHVSREEEPKKEIDIVDEEFEEDIYEQEVESKEDKKGIKDKFYSFLGNIKKLLDEA